MSARFHLLNYRFHLLERNKLVIRGFFVDDEKDADLALRATLDKKELPQESEILFVSAEGHSRELRMIVALPEGWETASVLTLHPELNHQAGNRILLSVSELKKKILEVDANVDFSSIVNKKLKATGWACGTEPVQIRLCDAGHNEVDAQITRTERRDLAVEFPEKFDDVNAGFVVEAEVLHNRDLFLEFSVDGRKSVVPVYHSIFGTSAGELPGGSPQHILNKVYQYYKKFGIRETVSKIRQKLFQMRKVSYEQWLKTHEVTEKELREQMKEHLDGPKFSIVIPLFRTDPRFLKEMVDSVKGQTYSNWQLCLADGSITEDMPTSPLAKTLEKLAAEDSRIVYSILPANEGISGNTNAAIELADGEYIVFADHDDLLARNALYECAKVLKEEPGTDIIYSDEDKISTEGDRRFEPNFKPDFSPDFLRSVNYICHLFVVRKKLLDQVGHLDAAFDGAQDYDLILRCTEATKNIRHIPKILYHWRTHLDSTSMNPESKQYAFEAGKRAIKAHYDRLGLPAEVIDGPLPGVYHTVWKWEEQPLVSVLIPNKDHIEDLEKCLLSLEEKNTYRNIEIIIIENNSELDETFAYYKMIEEKYENVKIVYYEGSFNYSRINNFGEKYANGEYLLLLNNDTELIAADAIGQLLGYCMREDVGIVGARLLYSDDTVQHAGVVIGFGGVAGHTFIGKPEWDPGYQCRILAAQNYSAVTAACMMTKRNVFEEVGGLTEKLGVAFNDIDYCLKVRENNYLVVYNPNAVLHHYESKSRGLEDTAEKQERFRKEIAVFRERWGEILFAGDPYYNPNLTLYRSDFALKDTDPKEGRQS